MEHRSLGRPQSAPWNPFARSAALLLVASSVMACSPELDFGAWQADLSGTAVTFAGAESSWSGAVTLDVAYDKSRGSLSYQVTFCDGLVDYFSASPCFNTTSVLDTTDGLVGMQEEGWQAALGDGPAICQGTESISLVGDAKAKDEAEIELTYHLNLSSSSSASCSDLLSDETSRLVLSGTMVSVDP